MQDCAHGKKFFVKAIKVCGKAVMICSLCGAILFSPEAHEPVRQPVPLPTAIAQVALSTTSAAPVFFTTSPRRE